MNNIKRTLSVLVVVAMLFSIMSVNAFATVIEVTEGINLMEDVPNEMEDVSIEDVPNEENLLNQSEGESSTEDGQIQSLLPLEEVRAILDLRDYLPVELKSMTVKMVLEKLINEETGEPVPIDETATTVWSSASKDYGVNTDAWQVLGMNDKIVLDRTLGDEFQLIVGSGEQLDPNNIRYIVRMIYPYANELFKADVAVPDANDMPSEPQRELYLDSINIMDEETGDNEYVPVFTLPTDSFYGPEAGFLWSLSYIAPEEHEGLTVKIYAGNFASADDAIKAAKKNNEIDVTEKLWNQDLTIEGTGLELPVGIMNIFTVVFYRGDNATGSERFAMVAIPDDYEFSDIFTADLYVEDSEGTRMDVAKNQEDDSHITVDAEKKNMPLHNIGLPSYYGNEANILWNIAAVEGTLPKFVNIRVFDGNFDNVQNAFEAAEKKPEIEITNLILGPEAQGFAIPCNSEKIVTIVFCIGEKAIGSKNQALKTTPASYMELSEWFESNIFFADSKGNTTHIDEKPVNNGYKIVVDKENDIYRYYPRTTYKVDSYYGGEASFLWKLNFSSVVEDIPEKLTVKVFDGEYKSAEDAIAAAENKEELDITDKIWSNEAEGFSAPCNQNKKVTIVFYMSGSVIGSQVQVLHTSSKSYYGLGEWLCADAVYKFVEEGAEVVLPVANDEEDDFYPPYEEDEDEKQNPIHIVYIPSFFGKESGLYWNLGVNEYAENLTIRVFDGEFDSVEDALKNAEKAEITDKIVNATEDSEVPGFYIPCEENKLLTIVFVKSGVPVGSVKQLLLAEPDYYSGLNEYMDTEVYSEGSVSGREYVGCGRDRYIYKDNVRYPVNEITVPPYYGNETLLHWGLYSYFDDYESNLSVKVIDGIFDDGIKAIKAADQKPELDLTDKMLEVNMDEPGTGLAIPCGESKFLTLVFTIGGVPVGSAVQALRAARVGSDLSNYFRFELYDQDGAERTPVSIDRLRYEQFIEYEDEDGERTTDDRPTYTIHVPTSIKSDGKHYIGFDLNRENPEIFDGMQIKVFKGAFDSADAAFKAAERNSSLDITEAVTGNMEEQDVGYSAVFTREMKNGRFTYAPQFTVVFTDGETVFGTTNFEVVVTPNDKYVDVYYNIYEQDENGQKNSVGYREKTDESNGVINITYKLDREKSVKDEYFIRMEYSDDDGGEIQKAVIGHFNTLESAVRAEDIKDKLFADDAVFDELDGGFKAKFNSGVKITVFDSAGEPWKYLIKAIADDSKPPKPVEPQPEKPEPQKLPLTGSSDRYFRIENVWNGETKLDSYFIPFDQDTYYYNGYQALLVNDEDAVMNDIIPEATLGYGAKVYVDSVAEDTGKPQSDDEYISKLSSRDFTRKAEGSDRERTPDNSFMYTVASENHKFNKNYWITVVRKTDNAQLYVNGPDKREIMLDNVYDNHHDIFIANLGSEPLTGINVELTGKNIELDKYWTIGKNGVNELAGFSTTEKTTEYGELPSVGKIRIIPTAEGDIEGTLTISADGQKPRKITITGRAGNPKIQGGKLPTAVKFVPYSSIITTDNMYDRVQVRFSLVDGALPDGIELLPSGELYGAPQETGQFKFKVRAVYSADGYNDNFNSFKPSEEEFTLRVENNTDSNVDAQTDDGYKIKTRVKDMTTYKDQVFEIEGALVEFMDFWLDGKRLIRDKDYTAEEGSTKITIKSQTFKSAGSGTHTIAGEFRKDGDRNQSMTKAAQNYTSGNSKKDGSSSSGGSKNSDSIRVVYKYTISFDTRGGNQLANINVDMNKAVGTLPVPKRAGYVFVGWYVDPGLTTPFDASRKYSYDFTVYAAWTPIQVKYTMSFNTNGGSPVDSIIINKGDVIPVLAVPTREGYIFAGWYVDEGFRNAIAQDATVWDNFTVYAKWVPVTPPADASGFADVDISAWYYNDVNWAYNNGIMLGVNNFEFAPDTIVTQCMATTVLARCAGVNIEQYKGENDTNWYTPYVNWAETAGLYKGVDVVPGEMITREDMCLIINNFLDYVGVEKAKSEGSVFNDDTFINENAKSAVYNLVNHGIINGIGNGYFSPDSATTRAQLAAMIHRIKNVMTEAK